MLDHHFVRTTITTTGTNRGHTTATLAIAVIAILAVGFVGGIVVGTQLSVAILTDHQLQPQLQPQPTVPPDLPPHTTAPLPTPHPPDTPTAAPTPAPPPAPTPPTPTPTPTPPEPITDPAPPLTASAATAMAPSSDPIPFADDLDAASLATALRSSLRHLSSSSTPQTLRFGPTTVSTSSLAAALQATLADLETLDSTGPEFLARLSSRFHLYESTAPSVLFTGYYLPLLHGSRTPSPRFRYPLYRRPDDLIRVELADFDFFPASSRVPRFVRARLGPGRRATPYPSRDAIDYEGALADRGLELLWVDCPIDRFFLHVQGSGVVALDDGTRTMIGYADASGRPYRSVGRHLIDTGVLCDDTVSMQAIRAHLTDNPARIRPVIGHDLSYVFFHEIQGGPFGCYGVPIVPWRTIATDRRIFPGGALCLLQLPAPLIGDDGSIEGWQAVTRLVTNLDTGGAIVGPGRVDLYCGAGERAETTAGHMNHEGRLFFLVPRELDERDDGV